MTKIEILGWESIGLRNVDYKIDFDKTQDSVYPASLLQMPNGTGKTTTLNLIRNALSGEAKNAGWSPEDTRQLCKPTPEDLGDEDGLFKLRVRFEDQHGSQEITYRLEFDWEEDSITYFTTIKGSGQEPGHKVPIAMRRFVRQSFIPYFIFDGELAEQLFDPKMNKADDAIRALFQLDVLDNLCERAEEYLKQQLSSVTKAKTQQSVNKMATRLEKIGRQKRKQIALLKDLEDKEAKLKTKIKHLKNDYSSKLEKNKQLSIKHQKATDAVDAARKSVKYLEGDLLVSLRKPHAISSEVANRLIELKKGLDKAQLPETAAREFFNEIAQEPECICGRKHDDASRAAIKERSQRYLGSDESGEINAFKERVSTVIEPDPEAPAEDLSSVLESLKAAERCVDDAMSNLNELTAELDSEDPELDKVTGNIKELETEVQQCVLDINRIVTDTRTTSDSLNPHNLEQEEKRVQKTYAEATGQVELQKKVTKLIEVLKESGENSKTNLAEGLIGGANQRIQELMPHNELVIRGIEKGALALQGQEMGSVGETMALGYSFLSILFERAADHLPFIVDSPAGALDLDVRKEVAALLPKLERQFIAFVTSSERQSFTRVLEDELPGKVLYKTIFRRSSDYMTDDLLDNEDVQVTDDGVVVSGEAYFNKFQEEELALAHLENNQAAKSFAKAGLADDGEGL